MKCVCVCVLLKCFSNESVFLPKILKELLKALDIFFLLKFWLSITGIRYLWAIVVSVCVCLCKMSVCVCVLCKIEIKK